MTMGARLRPRVILALCALAGAGCATLPQTPARRTQVAIDGTRWLIDGRPTHPGSPAEGLLINVRMVNAVLEDAGNAGRARLADFDPEANTARFIARIPAYLAQGVRSFTISLQGGLPGYEGAVNSAFTSDGALRAPYMARVIDAADRHGAVIILSAFFGPSHFSLPSFVGPSPFSVLLSLSSGAVYCDAVALTGVSSASRSPIAYCTPARMCASIAGIL